MYSIKYFLVSIALCFSFVLFSQSDFETLGETSVAINHKTSNNYSFNFSAKSRYYLYRDHNFNFEKRQLDLVHFSTLKLDYNHSISLGLQYRFRSGFDGGSNELRFTQQFNYTKKNEALRFGHRFRFQQRIFEDLTVFRTRYRLALDFPLNGEKLDIGEAYLVSSTEALLSISKKIKPEIDQRITMQIGWLISKKLKLQTGIEYRFEAYNINTEQRLFILSSAVLKI